MKMINPHFYIRKISFKDYKNHFSEILECVITFKNRNAIFRKDISKILESKMFIEISGSEKEIINLKLNNNENLFYEFYVLFSNLAERSFKEKVEFSSESYLDWVSRSNLTDLQVYQINEIFKNDLREYLTFINLKINLIMDSPKFTLYNLKKLFIDERNFEIIDFEKFKNLDIIFDSTKNGFHLRNRYQPDLVILISFLYKINLINLRVGDNYLEKINKIIKEFSGEEFDEGRISKLFNGVANNKYLSKNDITTLNSLKNILDK